MLLIDPDDRLLLFKFRVESADVWITPGGGVDPGETFEHGALRELWEETGLTDCELGPCVWLRSFLFRWNGRLYKQQERFFVVRTGVTAITDENWTEVEQEVLSEPRWWTLPDLAESSGRFAPSDLASLLPPILAGDYPLEPLALDR